jgi:hypothetical protein
MSGITGKPLELSLLTRQVSIQMLLEDEGLIILWAIHDYIQHTLLADHPSYRLWVNNQAELVQLVESREGQYLSIERWKFNLIRGSQEMIWIPDIIVMCSASMLTIT